MPKASPSPDAVEHDGDSGVQWRQRALVAEHQIELLRTVLDLLPDYFYVHDWNLRFQHINKAGASLLNLQPSQVIGRTYAEVDTNGPQAQRVVEICQSLMRRGGSERVHDFIFQTPEGTSKVLSQFNVAFKHPLTGEDMLLGVARDMTAETKLAGERAARQMLEQQMMMAGIIQRALEPKLEPKCPGFTIGARTKPSAYASGDFFDWWPVPAANGGEYPDLMLCLGDVTGHGVGAALNAAACRAYARSLLTGSTPLHEALGELNRRLCGEMADGRHVTFACIRLEPTSRRAHFASAGHGPTLLHRLCGEPVTLESGGLPLGVEESERHEPATRISLEAGDALALVSDGIIEARRPDVDASDTRAGLFSANGAREILASLARSGSTAGHIAERLVERALAHAQTQTPEDDMTVVVACAVAAE
ncbi:MAG: SpoIIE family protein phosphatase [Planctomycetota bacterium]|nr:SpoIIE family protein phosphatase [Planctomycetota bacterium]